MLLDVYLGGKLFLFLFSYVFTTSLAALFRIENFWLPNIPNIVKAGTVLKIIGNLLLGTPIAKIA